MSMKKIKRIVRDKFPLLWESHIQNSLEKRIKANKRLQPEEIVKKMYMEAFGREPDIVSPKRYTEKIQWRKLNNNNPTFSTLSDKYAVREFVNKTIGGEYLIPLLGVWHSFDEIDFTKLPNSFVLKTNNASSTVCVVRDQSKVNMKLLKKKFDYWMRMDYTYLQGYESQYKEIEPLIIAEKLIEDDSGKEDLRDYKFLCFGGEVYYVWVDYDRYHNHSRAVFDTQWNLQPWNQRYDVPAELTLERPKTLDEMVQVARKLSAGFDHVRVDLYSSGSKVYFGEMTFTNGSGYEAIVPDEWDYKLGELWEIR